MIELSLTGGSRPNPWGLVWQYWDGSDWQEIDDATDGSEDLTAEGDVVVAWLPRDDMESTTVDSIEGYAVRAFVTASGSGPMDAPTVTDTGYQTGLWWVEVDELEATTVRTATLYLSGPSFGRRDYGTRPATSANSDRPDATATLLNLRPTADLPAVLGPDGGGVLTGAIEPPVALVTVPNVKSKLPLFGDSIGRLSERQNVPQEFFWVLISFGLCIITLVIVHRLVDNILISVVAGGVVLTAAAAPTIGISTIWVLLVYGLIGGTVVIVGKRAQV